jgi:tRNA dimethylallyltransferase
LLIITGATAVGKTARAIEHALATNAEIVSCDSLLVYRGMDIGTAKPTAAERAAVPHHCLDLAEPCVPFCVADYIDAARAAIAGIHARGKNVIVTGGSGFYLKAFFGAVTDTISIAPEIAARVRAIAAAGLPALQEALLPFAPERPALLDWQNPRRVAKALERCLASGKPLAQIHAEFQARPGPFDAFTKHTIILKRTPADLVKRIEQRTRAMLDTGLVDEVRRLRDTGKLPANSPAAAAVGYRETLSWLEKEPLRTASKSTAGLAAAISHSTRQLAAKQHKWFRTQIPANETLHLSAA